MAGPAIGQYFADDLSLRILVRWISRMMTSIRGCNATGRRAAWVRSSPRPMSEVSLPESECCVIRHAPQGVVVDFALLR